MASEKEISAVKSVIKVLNGRGGFDHWWDAVDEVHDEIIQEAAEAIGKAPK